MTSILISHKLNELAKVADSITVLRDGSTVETIDCRAGQVSESRIIKSMVGREMTERYPPRNSAIGEELFSIRDWRVEHPQHAGRAVVKGVNLHVKRGEVVGIAGLMGAGRTELAMSVFGRAYGRNITGAAMLEGRDVKLDTIDDAIEAGLAYVTEDRKTTRTDPQRGHQAQHHARQTRRAFPKAASSTTRAKSRSPPVIAARCAFVPRASISGRSTFPAETSRRSC